MIGTLDKRVTIEKRSLTRVKGVKTADGWATIETVYGSLEPLRGYERRVAEQNGLIATHKVVLRYRDDLDGEELQYDMRFLIDGAEYEVREIKNPDFRNKWFQVMVESRR